MKYGIYHKDCEDGATSAALLKRAIPNIPLYAVKPDAWDITMTPLQEGDEIYFVDVCPLPEQLADLTSKKIRWVVIDHHITAKERIDKYSAEHPSFDFSNFNYYPDNCGATGVWKYFFKDKEQPAVLKFIEINDTWKWERDVNSKFIDQYIKTICKRGDVADYDKLIDSFDYDEAVDRGNLLYTKLMNDVAFVLKRASEINFDGQKELAINSQQNIDQIGNELAKISPTGLGVCYHISPEDDMVKFSVRGISGNGARKLAEKYGGGGHDMSSGFRMSIEQFFEILRKSKST